jgi:hypothetical protein
VVGVGLNSKLWAYGLSKVSFKPAVPYTSNHSNRKFRTIRLRCVTKKHKYALRVSDRPAEGWPPEGHIVMTP